MNDDRKTPKSGQGYNDARGEIPDTETTPKGNGQNVDNDPRRLAEKDAKNSKDLKSKSH